MSDREKEAWDLDKKSFIESLKKYDYEPSERDTALMDEWIGKVLDFTEKARDKDITISVRKGWGFFMVEFYTRNDLPDDFEFHYTTPMEFKDGDNKVIKVSIDVSYEYITISNFIGTWGNNIDSRTIIRYDRADADNYMQLALNELIEILVE